MEIVRKNNINVRKTVEKAISNHPEFHFFVDELSADNRMPTYAGLADEKYTFEEMDDGFFDFINRKIHENGVYLRICYMAGQEVEGEAIFDLEIAGKSSTFKTNDLDRVQVVEMADYGIKITPEEIIFGATIDGGCRITPYFAEFGSKDCNETFMSLENPLNRYIIALIGEFLDSI
ncbi:hypothetical protein [Methanobrevibacter sp.]|uniref:hypothetical protein n=1 Tax=Methanobrevibacter sp. TaxID=66852 RepID=UPI00386501A6